MKGFTIPAEAILRTAEFLITVDEGNALASAI
jgi:hypothetical protein